MGTRDRDDGRLGAGDAREASPGDGEAPTRRSAGSKRRLLRWGFWLGLPALHFAIGIGVFAYVFKSSFWVGTYRGIPFVDVLLFILWWPLFVAQPLLPENFLSKPYGPYVVVLNSFVWVYVARLVVLLVQRYRKRRAAHDGA